MLVLFLLLLPGFTSCINYTNHVLIDVEPNTKEQLKFLNNIVSYRETPTVFWKKPTQIYQAVQFLVHSSHEQDLLERLKHFGINVININRQLEFDANKLPISIEERPRLIIKDKLDFDKYHDYDTIYKWLEKLSKNNKESTELVIIGTTNLGKPIPALAVRHAGQKNMYNVVIEAGLHGNEWVPVAFVTYFIDKLVTGNFTDDPTFAEVAQNYNWFLVPIANPDGYDYSHKVDRMWKKNRNSQNIGVDLNRNFKYSWGLYDSSHNTEDDNYCGKKPFSEPETIALANFTNNLSRNLLFYFSFHSYGQNIIIPYGDSVNHEHTGNYQSMYHYAKEAANRIRREFGTVYSVGTYFDTNGFRISGNSASWVKKQYNIKYVYTFQMRDKGAFGFLLPPSQIVPSSEEMMTAIITIMTTKPAPRSRKYLLTASSNSVETNILLLLLWIIVLFLCEM